MARCDNKERGTDVDQKQIDELNAAKAAADAEESKISVSDSDVKSVGEKLMSFAAGLHPGERKHLWSMLDREPEKGADVQGFWWRDGWRTRFWRDWRWRHR
jgi:hypothetical protein